MSNNQQQKKLIAGLRPNPTVGEENTNITLPMGVKVFLSIVFACNTFNVLGYNTGWVTWTANQWDVIWATFLVCGNAFSLYMFNMFNLGNLRR